jgi:hypothetical protein
VEGGEQLPVHLSQEELSEGAAHIGPRWGSITNERERSYGPEFLQQEISKLEEGSDWVYEYLEHLKNDLRLDQRK